MLTIYRNPVFHVSSLDFKNPDGFERPIVLKIGAKIIRVGLKAEVFSIWYEVDPEQPDDRDVIHCYATGQLITHDIDKWVYFGSVELEGLRLLHIYVPRRFL